jgi:hypothetical protein
MHADIFMIILRNMLLVQILAILTRAADMPVIQHELLKIWRTLNTPLLPKRPEKPNHKSGRFWEIDMTKFEP